MSTARQVNHDPMMKCWIVGDREVGKSNLLKRAVDNLFTPSYMKSEIYSFYIKTFNIRGKEVKAQLWDISFDLHHSLHNSLHYEILRDATVCFVVYDIGNERSFLHAEKRLQALQEQEPKMSFVLIGNKCDLIAEERIVEYTRGKALADKFAIPFYETSAQRNTNVTDALVAGLESGLKKISPALFEKKIEPSPSLAERFLKGTWNVITAPFRGLWWLISWPVKKCFSASASQDQTDYQTLPTRKDTSAESKEVSGGSYSRQIMPGTGAAAEAKKLPQESKAHAKKVAEKPDRAEAILATYTHQQPTSTLSTDPLQPRRK